MTTQIETLFGEWNDKKASFHAYMHGDVSSIAGRKDIEIAKDILTLAGEQRPGQVIIREEFISNSAISDISRRIINANNSLMGWYGNPVSQGVVTNGAGLPLFGEDLRMSNRMSAIEWASLPLPG